MREHNEAVSRVDFITPRTAVTTEYAPGSVVDVPQHDGSLLRLRKLHTDHEPTDRSAGMAYLQSHQARGEILTGLLYVESGATDLHEALQTVEVPLNRLGVTERCPGVAALAPINAALR